MSALQQVLSKKTDKELLFYINNIDKHTDEAVRLALAELQKRNVELSENIEQDIKGKINERVIQGLEGNKVVWTNDAEEYLERPLHIIPKQPFMLFQSYFLFYLVHLC
ncbi:hypothetical protein [Pedobacter sp. NJ-S-72]